MDIKTIDLDKPETTQSPQSPTSSSGKSGLGKTVPVVLITVLLGIVGFVAGGFVKSGLTTSQQSTSLAPTVDVPEEGLKVGDIYGSPDEKAFVSSATGVLEKGGLNGEGTHKLLRPGGTSQTAYLTSSVIDLDLLVGHQITIWGETFKGQKAGWLMDVGRAQVEQLNAPLPE
jgi:hypothetical protein